MYAILFIYVNYQNCITNQILYTYANTNVLNMYISTDNLNVFDTLILKPLRNIGKLLKFHFTTPSCMK